MHRTARNTPPTFNLLPVSAKVLSSAELSSYRETGYLIVKNVVDREWIDRLFFTLIPIYEHYSGQTWRHDDAHRIWEDPAFHQTLIRFREKAPKRFGLMYNSMNLTLALQSFFGNSTLTELAAQLLDTCADVMAVTGKMLRMDPPYDRRNVLDWHQDSSYYLQNERGENGLVCWTPMLAVNADNGSLKFCVGSHKGGKLDLTSIKKSHETSEQWPVPPEVVAKYEHMDLVAEPGDAGFFNMDLIHRSGENTSDRIRFVAGIRYHKILSEDFNSGYLMYHLIGQK